MKAFQTAAAGHEYITLHSGPLLFQMIYANFVGFKSRVASYIILCILLFKFSRILWVILYPEF